MGTEWTKRDVIDRLDHYVFNLRILEARSLQSGSRDTDFALPAEWSEKYLDSESLFRFDLAGIQASGHPGVFDDSAVAECATPEKFLKFIVNSLEPTGRTSLADEWLTSPAETITLDPRYVAFRTAHDWVILQARILAEDGGAEREKASDLTDRVDPFLSALPYDDPEEPMGLIAGSPLHLADGGARNRWDGNFAEVWSEVKDHISAIRYFHFLGTLYRRSEYTWPLELLSPEPFADYISASIIKDQNSDRFQAWPNMPLEEVERDLRFAAFKCAFDRGVILRIASQRYKKSLREVNPPVEVTISGSIFDEVPLAEGKAIGLEFIDEDD